MFHTFRPTYRLTSGPKWTKSFPVLFYSKINKSLEYKKCYETLGVSEGCDQEDVRKAYLLLVKMYHPDNPDGDLKKFQEIDRAFRILTQKKSRERWGVEDNYEMKAEEFDIKHTAPQHRQYLSYDGVGAGTPFQRQKQHAKYRAMKAAENVLEHRLAKAAADEKSLIEKKSTLDHKIKTKYGFDRLVEDLIQESMSKGEFNNLAGCGKPLKEHQDSNPYVDFVTHKINQVLIDNGFTPEWISLQKEIREEIQVLRNDLSVERNRFGPHPFNKEDENDWSIIVDKYRKLAENLNRKIDKFNLVVPVLNKQMLLVDLRREATEVVLKGKHSGEGRIKVKEVVIQEERSNKENIFSFFDEIFRK